MAGIYIHIPFCRQACNYCDFHFSTSMRHKGDMVNALNQELVQRKDYLGEAAVNTLYFGGGTPSLLTEEELQSIMHTLHQHYNLEKLGECTLEANPDDMNANYLSMLKRLGINRLSIGVQSFVEQDLRFMNRAHTASEALDAIKTAQDIGLDNITIDLIYGTPGLSDEQWQENLFTAINSGIQHISAYALTVEERTALAHQIKQGKVAAPMSEQAATQFEIMLGMLKKAGFVHYEISNFAKDGFFAQHNTNYWKGVPYLGIGPSAHSFNGHSRQWNIANNALYIKAINNQTQAFEIEHLSIADQMNELILTGLRTMWGISLADFAERFGTDAQTQLLIAAQKIDPAHLIISTDCLVLTDAGKLYADNIALRLFF